MLDFFLDIFDSFLDIDTTDIDNAIEESSDFWDSFQTPDDNLFDDDMYEFKGFINNEDIVGEHRGQVSFGSLFVQNSSDSSFNPYGTYSPFDSISNRPLHPIGSNDTILGHVNIWTDKPSIHFGPISNPDAACFETIGKLHPCVNNDFLGSHWSAMMGSNVAHDQVSFDSIKNKQNFLKAEIDLKLNNA